MRKHVKLHMWIEVDGVEKRLCDGKKKYEPHIPPGSLVMMCSMCAVKVYMDERAV